MKAVLTCQAVSGVLVAGAVWLVPMERAAARQVDIPRAPVGFNLLTVEQDVALGRRTAADIERSVAVHRHTRFDRLLDAVTSLLAAQAPGPRYAFGTRILGSGTVSALALPDGQIYLTVGLARLARTEAEVAALIAHQMAHVILRHGSLALTRAYLARAGVAGLGGLPGDGDAVGRMVASTGGSGRNAVYLSFPVSAEYEADALGAELLSLAGYEPAALATAVSAARRGDRGNGGDLPSFAASHPSAADRERRIRNLAIVLSQGGALELVGGFNTVRLRLDQLRLTRTETRWQTSAGSVVVRAATSPVRVPDPLPTWVRDGTPDGLFTIERPANWEARWSHAGLTTAPRGGVLEEAGTLPILVSGAVVNTYAPFEGDVDRWNHSLRRHYAPFADRSRPRGRLEDATDDLVRHLLDWNVHLSAPVGSARSASSGTDRTFSVLLTGRSPATGQPERVTVSTRLLPDDQVVLVVCVAPERSAAEVERACTRMLHSVRAVGSPAARP